MSINCSRYLSNIKTVKNAPQVLKGGVEKEVEKPNFLERIKNKVNEFKEVGFNKEDDLNLREEVQDRYDKLVNNKTDYSAPMTKKEQLTDRLVQKGFEKIFSASSDVYTDGMTDFSRARNNPNAEVMQNMDLLDEATKKALLEYGVKPNERGVHYNADSEISKKFANSPEVKKFFKENEELIRQGKKTGDNFNFDFALSQDKLDRYASLQHAKMIGAYYDENGKKHGRFIDNVDYEQRHPDTLKDTFKTYFNNHGYNMQEKGNFENYYIVMDILLDDSIADSKKKHLLQKILNK